MGVLFGSKKIQAEMKQMKKRVLMAGVFLVNNGRVYVFKTPLN